MDRRDFLRLLGATTVGAVGAAAIPSWLANDGTGRSTAATRPVVPTDPAISGRKVAVVGGGMAGATAAKYLRLWGGTGLAVTLIDQNPAYTSNIMSSMVLVGERTLSSLVYTYDLLRSYGVSVQTGTVASIDPAGKMVWIAGQATPLGPFDALVLAPGLEFTTDQLGPGYDVALTPHAWQAGAQTTQLAAQLATMTPGDPVIVTIPKSPYRCPPGPYERACVIADWLKANKPGSQLYLLDANSGIQAQATNFQRAFAGTNASGYTVTYRPGVTNLVVDSVARTVTYSYNGTAITQQGVLNPIPPMRAPAILRDAGLTGTPGGNGMVFAPVKPLTFESTKAAGVYVIGDPSSVPAEWYPGYTGDPAVGIPGIPKAGHIGNQEGKTAASAIVRALRNDPVETELVLNSACYTPITRSIGTTPGTATWLSAVYQYEAATDRMYAVKGQPVAATAATTSNFTDMLTWFNTVMRDTFG